MDGVVLRIRNIVKKDHLPATRYSSMEPPTEFINSAGPGRGELAPRQKQNKVPLWPEGNFILFLSRCKFSSAGPRGIDKFRGWFHGGVPRSGEVVFFYNITDSQDHPVHYVDTPPPEGNLDRFYSCHCERSEAIHKPTRVPRSGEVVFYFLSLRGNGPRPTPG